MSTHNSDYEDLGAAAVAEPERDLEGRRLDWVDTVWLGDLAGWQVMGDEDCGVSIRCPRCTERDIDAPWTLVPANGYAWLANLVDAALEHKCPEAGSCINGYAEHDWDQPAGRPPTVCIRCDILKQAG